MGLNSLEKLVIYLMVIKKCEINRKIGPETYLGPTIPDVRTMMELLGVQLNKKMYFTGV